MFRRIARPTGPGLRRAPITVMQQRLQTDDVGDPTSGLVRAQVGFILCEFDRAVHLRSVEVAGDAAAQVVEDLQCVVVLGQGVGAERGDACRTRGVREVFQQEGGHTSVVPVVGYGRRDLRPAAARQNLVLGQPHKPFTALGGQRALSGPFAPGHPLGGLPGEGRADGEVGPHRGR